ncbi:MAG: hypothetical protein J0H74_06900 [Chitinophagaceae bacterium]|nr:hypothetical protein [Chitinophagaceae bacterium]
MAALMDHPRKLLWKTLVRQYYRQNTGFFLFFFLVFFGVVAPSQQLTYHYALIRGMLATPTFLILVLFLWLLYATKCGQWITGLQRGPDHIFLYMLPLMGKVRAFQLLLEVQLMLFMPVILYALAVVSVALYESAWIPAAVVSFFILLVCLTSVVVYQYELFHPEIFRRVSFHNRAGKRRWRTFYWSFLSRSFFSEHKVLLAGIKLFGCGILYLLLETQSPDSYDIRLPFLIFSMALFGHSVLIHQLRGMEEQRLLFYRGMPVSLPGRWMQYGILYFLVLLPEMVTITWLTPDHIRVKDAFGFALAGYTTLLLLNSCLFIAALRKSDFIKLTFVLFGILYFGVLSDNLILLSGLFLVTAGSLFFRGYCRWEDRGQ